MTTQKPSARFTWTEGLPGQVAAPDDTLRNSGWTAGQPIAAQHINQIFYELGQWVGWLDENQGATVLAATLDSSVRLIGGGTLRYAAATATLSWSQPLVLSVPSVADVDNTLAAGGISIPAGYLAYTLANVPFTTTGDVTEGSTTVSNLAYDLPIEAGQTVTGPGIPSGTTVASLDGASLTLSQPAGTTIPQAALTFCGTGALTVQTAPVASFVPAANAVVLARGMGSHVFVGVNAAVAVLHDQEARTLLEPGYLGVIRVPAGQALSAGQAVYISTNFSGTRTAGAAYPTDCSPANGATRALCAGICFAAAASGAPCSIVTGGVVPLAGGWAPGMALYLDPNTPGALTVIPPPLSITPYCVQVGFALDAATLYLRPQPIQDGIFPSVQALSGAFGALASTGATTLGGDVNVAGTLVSNGTVSGKFLLAQDGSQTAPGVGFQNNPKTGLWHNNIGTAAQEQLVAVLAGVPLVMLTTVGTVVQSPTGGAPLLINSSSGTNLGTINNAGVVNFPSFVSAAGFKADMPCGAYYNGSYPGGTVSLGITAGNTTGGSIAVTPWSMPMTYAGSIVGWSFTHFGTTTANFSYSILVNGTAVINGGLNNATAGSKGATNTTKGRYPFNVGDVLTATCGWSASGNMGVQMFITVEHGA